MYSAGEWQQLGQDAESGNSSRLFIVKATIDARLEPIFDEPIKINVLEDGRARVTDMKKLTIQF